MRADHDGSDDEGPLRTSNVRRCDGAIVRKHWRGVALTMAIPSLLAGLTACSSGRSVEAFCSTWETETTAFANEYQEAGDNVAAASEDDPLGALLGGTLALTQSVGDVIIVFERLQRVAPADIQPDVTAIRDSLESQRDSAGDMLNNPLGALAGGLFQGLTTGGSWQRVGEYVEANCALQ